MKCFVGEPLINASKKSRSGSEIDNRRASDTSWIKTSARGGWDRRTNIGARPDREARRGVERINIVRFGHRNNHRPIRAALDVKRLGVNVAGDRAIEVEIARQIRGGRRRKCRIDVNAVAGRIVVLLRDVDLRIGRQSAQCSKQQ